MTKTRRARVLRVIFRAFGHYGEKCWRCGLPVAWGAVTWWTAPDCLWAAVAGDPLGGVLCMRCFVRKATKRGYLVSWEAVVQKNIGSVAERTKAPHC